VEHLSGDFLLKVHTAISWVALDQLANYSFAPADIPVLEKIKFQGKDILDSIEIET
jgi:hypothetical protein